ncbi:PREDICTED: non-syndromic hearing impairment protein 5 [Nanorana parkeri]|uniref:non-syndromic hearing impairment protein 5 n=1 Tax=Nanorana parkeri TaxID=125878 RepID=UPI000854A5FB|nr:PREDICTED: non-syndromic hearing impairment protein 5 [Nanorana parkeri]
MFCKASRTFLKEIDAGGELIPVCSLNDSAKAQLLSVVVKKNRFWWWQKPKYNFSACGCLLGDVLMDDKPVKPVVVESEFVKYQGSYGDVIRANVDADFGAFHGNAAGSGRVQTTSTFGALRKQEVDMNHLMKDVQNRKINLHHPFIQQLHGYKRDLLCIVKEKIITTQKCVISEHAQSEETFGGKLGVKAKMVKVSVTENGDFIQDENTVLEIPAPTALAYAVVEVFVKCDGQFEFSLLPEKQGGFEKECIEKYQHAEPLLRNTVSLCDWDVVDGKTVPSITSLAVIKQDILELTKPFSMLQDLPEAQRGELYNWLFEILDDGQTVTQLQAVVEEIRLGNGTGLNFLDEVKSPERERVQKILCLIGYDMEKHKLMKTYKKDLLAAVHILTSALDEMPDTALAILGACCKLNLLPALWALPNTTSDEGLCSRTEPALADLIDQGTFQIAQRLFSLSNMRLELNEKNISAVTSQDSGFLPHILYIAISGFHALKNNLKT